MKVRLAKSSGFCMGVRRAMETALETVHDRPGPIYSHGPLIHNPQAVALLASKGLRAHDFQTPPDCDSGAVIIRAHGIPPEERARLADMDLEVIDATCPRVIRVQQIIKRHTEKGASAIIWGNPTHPEVIGLLGHAGERGHVIEGPEDVAGLPELDRVILAAQTTQHQERLAEVVEAVKARWPEALVFDTICGATRRRQDEVRELARQVDAMVVVGGRDSGNTRRLAAVAEAEGVKTIHVETEAELPSDWLSGVERVGVTAGASTPNWMIKRVIRKLERYSRHQDLSLLTQARRLLRVLVLSNLYVSLGAGVLCLAAAMLQGLSPRFSYFAVTFFYVHAMHVLNLFLDKEASQFNDPDRVHFLEKYKRVLLGAGAASAVVSLIWGLTLNLKVFFFLLAMSLLGLMYAVPVIPDPRSGFRLRRLKDVPVSKTLSLAGGWAFCLSLVPALSPWGRLTGSTAAAAVVVFIMVFIRSALGDVLEVQGDRVAGRETLPIILGEKRTLILIRAAGGVLGLALVAGWAAGLLTSLAPWLLICAVYAVGYSLWIQREGFMGSIFFEAIIDANFLLAGLISWLWLAAG